MKQDILAIVNFGDKTESYPVIKATANHFICRSQLGDLKFKRSNGRAEGGKVAIQNLNELEAHFGADAAIKYAKPNGECVLAVKVIKDNKAGQILQILELVYGKMPRKNGYGAGDFVIGEMVETDSGRYRSMWKLFETKAEVLSDLMYTAMSRLNTNTLSIASDIKDYQRHAAALTVLHDLDPATFQSTASRRKEYRDSQVEYPPPDVRLIVDQAMISAESADDESDDE